MASMRAEIKGYHSVGVPDPASWRPARLEDVYLPLELSIGSAGTEAADLWQIVVATPQALQGRPDRRRCKLLVVQDYDWEAIRASLERLVLECEGEDWAGIVRRLREHFQWEYESLGDPA